ncbi:MAG: hypothetical protein WCB68_11935 [Pyrinomonadaceae bacterium]
MADWVIKTEIGFLLNVGRLQTQTSGLLTPAVVFEKTADGTRSRVASATPDVESVLSKEQSTIYEEE